DTYGYEHSINDLWVKSGSHEMPIRFKYVICVCSEEEKFEECIKEWVGVNNQQTINDNLYFCICSHWIKEMIYVDNIKNGNRLIVGNCCIDKFGSKELKSDAKIILGDRKEHKLKRCKNCCQFKIYNDDDVCKSCEPKISEEYKRVYKDTLETFCSEGCKKLANNGALCDDCIH